MKYFKNKWKKIKLHDICTSCKYNFLLQQTNYCNILKYLKINKETSAKNLEIFEN